MRLGTTKVADPDRLVDLDVEVSDRTLMAPHVCFRTYQHLQWIIGFLVVSSGAQRSPIGRRASTDQGHIP